MSAAMLNGQKVTLLQHGTNTAIADALLIQDGKLLGITDEHGHCHVTITKGSSKVCIKAFGYVDTCLVMSKNQEHVFLHPQTFQTGEVSIQAEALTVKEQFLKALQHSISLCNHQKELRTYSYTTEARPHSSVLIDRMVGAYQYTHPAVSKLTNYRSLHICSAEHSISKELFSDSITRFEMSKGSVPYTVMHLYHLSSRYVNAYRKRMDESKLYHTVTDSLSVYMYIDSTVYPVQYTWRFDQSGRLMECEFIQILEEGTRAFLRPLGRRYVRQVYTTSGVLRIAHVEAIQTYISKNGVAYSVHTLLDYQPEMDCTIEKNANDIPIGLSISAWGKLHQLPCTIIDDEVNE
jgi:hypothetical protein